MITAVIHGDTHGIWATIDEVPTYTATTDGDTIDLMSIVQEAIDVDILEMHDDDLRWRWCRNPGPVMVVRDPSQMFGLRPPPKCHGKCLGVAS